MTEVSGIGGFVNVGPPPLSGSGAPAATLPAQQGQLYFDVSVTPRNVYVFTGLTWLLIGTTTSSGFTLDGVLYGLGGTGIAATAAGTNGQVLLGATGAAPAFGTITSSTLSLTLGANSLALNTKQGGFAVTSVAGTSQALAVQSAYVANNAGATTFTLPATAAVGDQILISGGTANTAGWVIAQNAGQTIHHEASASTTGVTGTATSAAHACETIALMCITANTDFVILYSNGTVALA
jgi:hypothetical protein